MVGQKWAEFPANLDTHFLRMVGGGGGGGFRDVGRRGKISFLKIYGALLYRVHVGQLRLSKQIVTKLWEYITKILLLCASYKYIWSNQLWNLLHFSAIFPTKLVDSSKDLIRLSCQIQVSNYKHKSETSVLRNTSKITKTLYSENTVHIFVEGYNT